jgi:threonine dehydrogenase-like Zn-dependent dehydrogenase
MRDLLLYKELCRIDMRNNNIYPKYPYTLQEDLVFTQHEMVLHYKQNYCKDIVVLTEPKATTGGAAEEDMPEPDYSFVVYDDESD